MDFFLQGELCSESDDTSILECEYRHGGFHDDDYEAISLYRKIEGKRIWWVVGEGGRASEWCVEGAMVVKDRTMGVTVYVSARAFLNGGDVLDFMNKRDMEIEVFRLQEQLECYQLTKQKELKDEN